ncbi:MAG: Imm1 family immunity protein [Planctomycetaceae bacterium]
MSHVRYTNIVGKVIDHPDETQMRHDLSEVPWRQWYRCLQGAAMLEVVSDENDPHSVRPGKTSPQPVLIVAQPNADEFLLSWLEDRREWVPWNGGTCEAFSTYFSGGNEHRIPDDCLVDSETALRVMLHFVTQQTRDNSVTWTRLDELPVEADFWEPM